MYKTEFCQCLYILEGLDIPFIGSHFAWSSRWEDNYFVVKAGQGDREYQVVVSYQLAWSFLTPGISDHSHALMCISAIFLRRTSICQYWFGPKHSKFSNVGLS